MSAHAAHRFYTAYGLTIRADDSLPALFPSSPVELADVDLVFHRGTTEPDFLDLELRYDGQDLRVLGDTRHFLLCYSDGVEFRVDRNGSQVSASWPDSLSLDDVIPYLIGPVLGFVLRLRGILCLHASAVVLGDQAWAFCGPWGAGKSTVAAGFLSAGYRVLADDVVACAEHAGRFWVQPGCPRLKLWPESEELLFGTRNTLPTWSPNWDKRFLELGKSFCAEPKELAGVVMLARNEESAPVRIRRMRAPEAFITLVANSCTNYLLDHEMRRQEFEVLGRLVSGVEVKELTFAAGAPDVRNLLSLLGCLNHLT